MLVVYRAKQPVENDRFAVLTSYLANAFDGSGKLQSVVYGLADPIFREAAIKGRIKDPVDAPDERQALAAARDLGAEFLLYVLAAPVGNRLQAEGKLLRNGRELWRDRQTAGVELAGQLSPEATAQSLASEWSRKLLDGPLKALDAAPVIPTPDPEPGQITPTPPPETTPPPPTVPPSLDRVRNSVDQAFQQNDKFGAIGLARDAVDERPLDGERRRLLYDVLLRAGRPDLAGEQARATARVFPAEPAWRILSARALLLAFRPEEARAELNEAVARDPDAPETRRLLGEIALSAGQYPQALEHLEGAQTREASPDGFVLRALALVALGEGERAARDLEQARKDRPEALAERYDFVAGVLDRLAAADVTALRDATQNAVVRRDSPEVARALRDLTVRARARIALMDALTPPSIHARSADRFGLSQRVFVQAVQGVQDYVQDGSEDTLANARIDLAEALKGLTLARDEFAKEREAGG